MPDYVSNKPLKIVRIMNDDTIINKEILKIPLIIFKSASILEKISIFLLFWY